MSILFKNFPINPSKEDSGILLDSDYIIESPNNNIIPELRKMNIFVGANNSGKSRILRAIFKQKYLMNHELSQKFIKFIADLKVINNKSRFMKGQARNIQNLLDRNSIFDKNFWIFNDGENILRIINEATNDIRSQIGNTVYRLNGEPNITEELSFFLREYTPLLKDINDYIDKIKIYRIYIPILRGMRTMGDIHSDPYGSRTKTDYFSTVENEFHRISSGLGIYKDIREKLLGSQSDRTFIKIYEDFLSKKFFNDHKITLVPREKDSSGNDNDVIHITFNDNEGQERAIYQYGDGLQNIICVTYPIFSWLAKNNDKRDNYLLVCIEEPEMYLHPSMQRKLVEVLMGDEFDNIQYFITTHSNHFLDLLYEPIYKKDISIYSVTIDEKEIKTVKRESDLSDIVYELLGSKPSSLLLANKTIWVEGVTDRLYIRHGIKLYFESSEHDEEVIPSEDLDYAFVEYGGSNLAHYLKEENDLDINSISNTRNVFLIADNDNVGKNTKKYKRYEKIKEEIEKSNGIFKITDGKEIENYILPTILKGVYPDLSEGIKHKDYYKSNLPGFLKSNSCTKYLSKEFSRFNDKSKFAIDIIENQKLWTDLSTEMQNLIKEIIDFIKK